MPTTVNRGYVTPSHGASVDSWDTPVNTIFSQIDSNFGATSTVSMSNVDVTLNSSQYVCGTIVLGGTLTGNCRVLFPNVSGWWTIVNNSTTSNSIYVAARLASGGRQIGLPPGEPIDIFSDGTNMYYRNLGVIGMEYPYASTTVPAWILNSTVPPFLNEDGSSFNPATYPYLYTLLGTSTLPDSRGRGRFNYNAGTGRLTSAGGINGDSLGAAGGVGSGITISQSNLPSVNFSISGITLSDPGHTHGVSGGTVAGTTATTATIGAGPTSIPINTSTPVVGANTTGITISSQGSAASGGSGSAIATVSPGYVGGLTLIRAA
jgi:hypothetical protein